VSKLETMLRILLANFIVQVLPLLMIAAGILLVLKARKRRPGSSLKHYLGISLAAIPAGIIAYIASGIGSHAFVVKAIFTAFLLAAMAWITGPSAPAFVLWIALIFAGLAVVLRPPA
jgi:hypothetical protein